MVMRIKYGEKGKMKLVFNCHVFLSQNKLVYTTANRSLETL